PLEPLTAAFLGRVLSAPGQALVSQDGYLPLPEMAREQARQLLGLDDAAPASDSDPAKNR
ncbi:phosphate ABC transporter substrate-binding protein, partial [Dickeya undicola]